LKSCGFAIPRDRTVLDIPVKLAILAAVAWVIWRIVQPRALFVLELVDGTPRTKSGKVTAALLSELAGLCREQGVTRGRIRGVSRRGGRIALQFSREFPAGLQQQIRNCWEAVR
jgi:hypothetical protein